MQKGIIETLKEAGRIAFFAALAALLGWVTTQVSTLDPGSYAGIIGTVILRLVDKFIHENKDIKAKGLAPF